MLTSFTCLLEDGLGHRSQGLSTEVRKWRGRLEFGALRSPRLLDTVNNMYKRIDMFTDHCWHSPPWQCVLVLKYLSSSNLLLASARDHCWLSARWPLACAGVALRLVSGEQQVQETIADAVHPDPANCILHLCLLAVASTRVCVLAVPSRRVCFFSSIKCKCTCTQSCTLDYVCWQ